MCRPRLAEMTEPLAGPRYRLFFAAQVISSSGSAVAPIALAFAILAIGGDGSGIALVLGAEFVVYTLLLPLTGVIADPAAGLGALVISQVTAAVFQLTEAVLIISGTATVWSLAIVAAGGAAGAALFTPIGRRVIPQLVPADQLSRANALSQTARHGIAMIGPVAGGVLAATAGPEWGICWDSLTFVAAAVAGAAYGPAGVTRQTLIQQHIPHHELGRVSANIELAESIPIPMTYAIAGTTADRLGTQAVMTACAAIIAAAGLIPLALRDVRRLVLLPADSVTVFAQDGVGRS
jgi:MFS family permease